MCCDCMGTDKTQLGKRSAAIRAKAALPGPQLTGLVRTQRRWTAVEISAASRVSADWQLLVPFAQGRGAKNAAANILA